MRKIIWCCVVILLIVHQDFWWWDDTSVVLGFLPLGLAYHALISILASILWTLAIIYAWPQNLEGEE